MNVAYYILDLAGTVLRSGICTQEDIESTYDANTEVFMEAPILEEPNNPTYSDPILTTDALDQAKISATRMIDENAETIRGRYITLGSGQAMVYQQKQLEAETVSADLEINPSLVPHIAYEAALNQITLLDQAAIVLTMAEQWKMVSAYIEAARLGAKAQIAGLGSIEDVKAFMTLNHFEGL